MIANSSINMISLLAGIESPADPNATFTIHPKELDLFNMANIDFIDDKTVSYKYNSQGFRCDDFTNASESTVVFAGCSEGEGIGGNINDTWPKIIYDNLNIDNQLGGFFNLSCDNFGYHKIINNCIYYINNYGKPGSIVILFPDMSRSYIWNSESNEYVQDWINTKKKMSLEEKNRIMQHLINFTQTILLFEEYCNSNNIKLYWSTLCDHDLELFKSLNVFKNFVNMDYEKYPVMSDFERRDGHHGTGYHLSWAKNFLDRISNA